MIQLRQTVTYSLSIQAMIKRKMEDPAYQFSGRWPCRRSYSWSGKSGYPFTGRYLTVYLDTLQKLDLKEMTSYLGVVNIMNTSDTAKIPLPQHLPNRFIKILIMSLNPAVKMDTMPLLQLKLQPLTVIRSWLIIRKSLINIWLLLTQLSMAPRNDTRNLSKFFWTVSMIIPLLPSMM